MQLAVRIHRTLELADDKFYVITCGKGGLTRDENSHVVLKFLEPTTSKRARETVYGRPYTIRAEVTQPNTTYGIRVHSCFAFNKKNVSIPLIDDRGCPINRDIITTFKNADDGQSATAHLGSMFKFPDGSEVHLQCDVAQCLGRCNEALDCDNEVLRAGAVVTSQTKGGALPKAGESMQLAATTVFVLDPAEAPSECSIDC